MNLVFSWGTGLIISSVVGSVVFIALLLFRPITDKMFSKTWHYYSLLVPLIFLFGGTHIVISLTGLISNPALENTSPILVQDMYTDIPLEFTRPPTFDNPTSNMPIHYDGVYANCAITSSITSRLIIYIERVIPFLMVIWILGVIFFIVINIKKYLQYRCLILHNAKSTNINCTLPIIISISAHTPMLIGMVKPIIVLPSMYFSDKELEMVLAHEMVHYSRKDLFVKCIMLIANAIHWFNPVVYVLNRQLNTTCELSCDEKVVSKMDTHNRRLYGETILHVLQYSTSKQSLVDNVAFATNLCKSKKNFKRRLISMMNTKKMKKSAIALALATVVLVAIGGFVISNLVHSAMPIVYASDTLQNDTRVAIGAISPLLSPELNDSTSSIEEVASGHIPLWGWAEDSWYFAPISFVDELPFTVAPITDISKLADFATHHSAGNVLLPTYIPQGFNFDHAEFRGWANHMYTAVSEMSPDELFPLVFNEENHLGLGGSLMPLENGTSLLMTGAGFEANLLYGFDWELAALTPDFDTLRIYYTHDNSIFTTITVWVRIYGGWGWNDPDMWGNMSEITVNGMSGFMSGTELHLRDVDTNIMYTIVSSSRATANQDTLIRIAESLR